MRFQRLQIPAFGPFVNLELQFREQAHDLHVIYGANEAGKSSLLRAIRDLLFGIRAQSSDNFLHDYADLRIKGEIRNRAGEQLVFQRRKGNRNTLLDAEGKQLPDTALLPFLGSVDQAYFSAMFGLGVRELQEGAEQLLRGEGEIGAALFSASMGGTPVQKAAATLQEEADRLFRGRATTNVSIRPTASQYKEFLKQSREAMVNPEAWEKIELELATATDEGKRLETAIFALDHDLGWIARCEDALPTVGRLSEAMQQLASLPPLPMLASDFVTRARTARQNHAQALLEVQRLATHIDTLRAQSDACKINPSILGEAESLDQLHQDLGVYRERKKSLSSLQLKLAGLDRLIRAGMQSLQFTGELNTLESRRLSTAAQLACEQASRNLQKILQDQSAIAEKAASVKNQIEARETDLQLVTETNLEGLRDALAIAAEATDADKTLGETEALVQRLTRETTGQHRFLTGAPEDFEAAARLAVPSLATLRRYREKMDGINRDISNELKEMKDTKKRGAAIQAELTRLQRQGELPTEEALRNAREHRDHGWNLVLAAWKGPGANEDLEAGSPLEVAFPRSIEKADEIADKLRLDAEAVAQAEEKRLQLTEVEQELGDANQNIQKLQCSLEKAQRSWQAEWSACGIVARSPLEMEEWREAWSDFKDLLANLKTAQENWQRKRGQVDRARQRLAQVLGQAPEKEFSLLFAAARKQVQEGEQAAGRRIEMVNQLAALRRELESLEKKSASLERAVVASKEDWSAQCVAVGLPQGTAPESGIALLTARKDLLLKFDEWQEASSKSQLTTELITQYERSVSEKAAVLSIAGETTEGIESSLWKALSEARQAKERHDYLSKQAHEAATQLEKAQQHAALSEQSLGELLRVAGLNTVADLEPLLANLEQRSTSQNQIDDLRNTLGGLARGLGVDDFISRVRAENPETLAERKSTADRSKAEHANALSKIRESIARLAIEKQNLEKAGDAAADLRQQAESCAAKLKQDAGRYLRLRLATHLLQVQVERFRRENQDPLLKKSGEIFKAITRGAFGGLSADFNADDLPVLVGLRQDGTKVPVEGLSDGSRDQLYLALRLAALDRYLQEHEPMPLILDDLLITCDNDRSKAILPQLLELSRRTQIFLFTHHDHLVDLCRQTLGEEQFQLHRLGSGRD